MIGTELSARERDIILKIVELYISTGEPIGSRTLQKRYSMPISPATIRNVMADLEEKGYLYQPHTSAGRLPTDKGLRFYINSLFLTINDMDVNAVNRMLSYIKSLGRTNFEDIFSSVLKYLTKMTGYTGLGVSFLVDVLNLKEISFMKVSKKKVLAIMNFEPDYVIHEIIEIDASADFLSKLSKELTQKFKGKTFSQIRKEIVNDIDKYRKEFLELSFKINSQMLSIINSIDSNLKVTGTFNVLNITDNLESLKETIKILEEKKMLLSFLDRLFNAENEVSVILGSETNVEVLKPFSIVASKYGFKSKSAGVIAVFGPKRMDYSKVIPTVENVSRALSKLLQEKEF
jgi:heat-inducible transcriptional repressor